MEDVFHPWIEKMIPLADEVLCTSTYLARKFGGRVVHMGVDTDLFSPRPEHVQHEIRSALGLEDCRVVLFGGVVRPHKGVEVMLEAVTQLGDRDVRFVVVGPPTEHLSALAADPRYERHLLCAGVQPRERMPDYLSMADVVAVPLADNALAQSQVPCKIFEAMAAGKPIVATRVSDVPGILGSCGWVVPPGDVDAARDALREALAGTAASEARGRAARQRCVDHFGLARTRQELLGVVDALYQGARRTG
jgi:glycosyltransferase involved in cell wall biosynthesis